MTKTSSILLAWLVLLLLLGLTMIASTILAGTVGLLTGLAIAMIKCGMVTWRYMHLDEQQGLERLASLGAVAWLLILFTMTGLDYLTR